MKDMRSESQRTQSRIMHLEQKTAELAQAISKMESARRNDQQENFIRKARKDGEKNAKELREMFGLDPDEDVEDASIIGLLEGICDPDDDSVDLVKSVRDG